MGLLVQGAWIFEWSLVYVANLLSVNALCESTSLILPIPPRIVKKSKTQAKQKPFLKFCISFNIVTLNIFSHICLQVVHSLLLICL